MQEIVPSQQSQPTQWLEPSLPAKLDELLLSSDLPTIGPKSAEILQQFVDAAKNIHKIKPKDCRKFAEQFLLENIAPRYEQYFESVTAVYSGQGWYQQ